MRKGTYKYSYPIKDKLREKGIFKPTNEQLQKMNISPSRWKMIFYQGVEPRVPELLEISKWLGCSLYDLIAAPKVPAIDEQKILETL